MAEDSFCTIVGYIFDGEDELCKDCARDLLVNEGVHEKRLSPIFNESNFETRPSCVSDGCDGEIPVKIAN